VRSIDSPIAWPTIKATVRWPEMLPLCGRVRGSERRRYHHQRGLALGASPPSASRSSRGRWKRREWAASGS